MTTSAQTNLYKSYTDNDANSECVRFINENIDMNYDLYSSDSCSSNMDVHYT